MTHRFRTTQPTAADARRRREYASPRHRQTRAAWQKRIDRGEPIWCWRCRKVRITPGMKWHLGHDDQDRTIYRGPECVPCNLTAAAKAGNRAQKAKRRRRPRPLAL